MASAKEYFVTDDLIKRILFVPCQAKKTSRQEYVILRNNFFFSDWFCWNMFMSICSRRITSTSRSLQLNHERVEMEREQTHLQNIPPPDAAVPQPITPATANICQRGVCCILKVKERILSTLSTSFTFALHSTTTYFKSRKTLNSSNASAFWSGLSDKSFVSLSSQCRSHKVKGWKDLMEDKLQLWGLSPQGAFLYVWSALRCPWAEYYTCVSDHEK